MNDRRTINRFLGSGLAAMAVLCVGCRESTAPDEAAGADVYVHTRACWSPDGRTIAFRSESSGAAGITLVDTSGSNQRLLQTGEGVGFTWSPDSRWLAFSTLGSLYKIRVNGDSLTRLTTGANDIRPSWSRDGTRIAFVRTGIWLLSMDSLIARSFSTTGNFPSWHPNGSEIVEMEVGQQIGNLEFMQFVEAITVSTGEHRTLYSFGSSDICGFGSISPTGERYVFSVQPEKGLAQIWTVDLATSTPTRLTSDGGDYPAWSPDGTMIVYTRTAQGDGALWMMRADGSGKRRLTSP